jgi:hypothetical protein
MVIFALRYVIIAFHSSYKVTDPIRALPFFVAEWSTLTFSGYLLAVVSVSKSISSGQGLD